MRHVMITIAVLACAGMGLRHVSGKQAAEQQARMQIAESLAESGQYLEAITELEKLQFGRLLPSTSSKLTAKREDLKRTLMRDGFETMLLTTDFETASKMIDAMQPQMTEAEIQSMRGKLDQSKAQAMGHTAEIMHFRVEASAASKKAEDLFESMSSSIRNPLADYGKRLADLQWESSELHRFLAEGKRLEETLADTEERIAELEAKLPDAPEKSLRPFKATKNEVRANLESTILTRSELIEEIRNGGLIVEKTLKSWGVPSGTPPADIRRLHCIASTPSWINMVGESTPKAKRKIQDALLRNLESALSELPESASQSKALKLLRYPVSDPQRHARAVYIAYFSAEDAP